MVIRLDYNYFTEVFLTTGPGGAKIFDSLLFIYSMLVIEMAHKNNLGEAFAQQWDSVDLKKEDIQIII